MDYLKNQWGARDDYTAKRSFAVPVLGLGLEPEHGFHGCSGYQTG